MEGEHDVAHFVAAAVDRAEGGERNVGVVAHLALVVLVDTNDGEAEVADFYHLSHDVGALVGRQLTCALVAHDDHLAPLLHVDVVDEPAGYHLALVDLGRVGIDAEDGTADIVLAERDDRRVVVDFGAHLVNVCVERMVGYGHVFIVQLYGPSLLQSVIAFGGESAKHHHRVGEKVVAVARQRIDEAIARAQQEDEHEDAPRHGESRERGA